VPSARLCDGEEGRCVVFAAKMNTESTPFRSEVESLRCQFETWRQTRQHGERIPESLESLSLVSPEEVTAVERLGHLDNVKERACVRFPGRFLRCKNWLAAVGWANVARHSLAETGACSI
jgi:hypothetical protein